MSGLTGGGIAVPSDECTLPDNCLPLDRTAMTEFDESEPLPFSSSPLFTVFTATYNRAHTLHRVFDSLRTQTLRDFEWLVVDDGSTDNTAELIAEWSKISDFSIRYFKQDHSGKHFAHNLAVREARGFLFAPIDSDDALVFNALERIAFVWNTIPPEIRPSFCGAGGLSRNQHGAVVGDRFPSDPFDANLRDRRYIHRIGGEKWGVTLTEIIRRFPLPEIRGTHFVPEGVIGLAIGKYYKIRNVNEVFRIYYIDDAETGATLSRVKSLSENAPGRLYYYVHLFNNDLEYFFDLPLPFLKAAVMLPIVARYSGRSFRSVLGSLEKPSARAVVLLALPLALLFYGSDRMSSLFRSLRTRATNLKVRRPTEKAASDVTTT
jgi:glycosyltransferase involved in cell wall biosynthesis